MSNTLRKEDVENCLAANLEGKVKGWVKEICDGIWQNNNAFMVSSASNNEKKDFFVANAKEEVTKLHKKMVNFIDEELNTSNMIDPQLLQSTTKDVKILINNHEIVLPIFTEQEKQVFQLKTLAKTLIIVLAIVVGTSIGNLFIFTGLGALIAATIGVFLTVYSSFLLDKFKDKPNRLSVMIKHHLYFNTLVKAGKYDFQNWREEFETFLLSYTSNLYKNLVDMYWLLCNLKLQAEDPTSENDIKILQEMFSQCCDSFAEVYYCDQKRDECEDRAIDACIKLIGDLSSMRIEPKFVPSGSAYEEAMDEFFHKLGLIQQGDNIITIYPAWTFKDRVIAKGKLKKQKQK